MSGSNIPGIESIVHGGDVYRNHVELDFSVNLNPYPLPKSIISAAISGLSQLNQYPDPLQHELKARIAAYEGIPDDRILCGNGASELLMAVCHAFLPCNALIAAPCYAGYRRALEAVGCDIKEYSTGEKTDFCLDDGFIDSITDDTDIVFIADPNNPNGRLIDPGLKERIVRTCEAKGIILVIDECFLPLTERGLEKNEITGKTLHLRAFTKTFAIPGIRVGYMISADKAMLSEIAMHLPEWNVSRIAERTGEAAAAVLRDTDYLADSVRLIEAERTYLRKELESMGVIVYGSDTNYLLIKAMPDLYDRLIRKGIMIRKCANFSGLDDTFFRIAVRIHKDNEILIQAMRDVI